MSLPPAAFERSIDSALAASPLAGIPAATLQRIRRGAMRMDLPEGALVRRACDEPFLAFVVDGLLRFFLDGPDGRRKTSRYARAGQLAGTPSIIGVPRPLPVGLQALTDTSLLVFEPSAVLRVVADDPSFSRALASDLTTALWDTLDELGRSAFGSVRERLSHHLIDLARPDGSGGALVVRAPHQELADAIGSVREVVARVLRQLRDEGLIATRASGITVLDAPGLIGRTWTGGTGLHLLPATA
jgi:CRP/FNR family cyclic AMP-dependent transcriptional regulator